MEYKEVYRLTLAHFQYFARMAESSTMLEAAESLGISQPLLSQKISQIEAALGVKLFRRYRQRMYLTEEGETLLAESKKLLGTTADMIERLHVGGDQMSSHELRIGFSYAYELSKIRRITDVLNEAFPDCTIQSVIAPRNELASMLLNDDLDLCCMLDTEMLIQNKKINYRRLYPTKLFCVVSNCSPLFQRESLELADLKDYPCLWPAHLKNMQMTKDIGKILLQEQKETGVEIKQKYVDMDYSTVRKYLHLSTGFTWLVSYDGILDDPSLKAFPVKEVSYPFVAAWRRENTRQLEPYIERVVAIYKKK